MKPHSRANNAASADGMASEMCTRPDLVGFWSCEAFAKRRVRGENQRSVPSEVGNMSDNDGKKRGSLSISDGGRAQERRTTAEREFELAVRALFFAMCGKDGRAINKNFRNIACGHTKPLRLVIRRFREAKAARAPRAYTQSKEIVHALDRYVDALHGRRHDTGEFKGPFAA